MRVLEGATGVGHGNGPWGGRAHSRVKSSVLEVQTAPPMTSLCPLMYFDTEFTETSAPSLCRRRDCHSVAPRSAFSRRFNRDDEAVPAE